MDVVVWLRSLSFRREYEEAFRDNKIDERVLPNLTQEDLKEIGVGPVGHRRILLDAFAALRTDAGVTRPSAAAGATSSAPSAHSEDRAERRQVTVMFSDLVGSTALSARMDPEDLREVISGYQKCVAETVQRFGGFVAKYMGDGVLIYFGYPQAHEDDAERAVRASLELVAAVGQLKTHAPLQTRVGIATGLVVVGDLIGSGASQEQAIVGETPNLAARLQGVAEPNSVVIAESTRKLIGDLFEFEKLGPKDLKGIAGPVRAWAVLRPALVESRFDAFHASGLTDLVGREEELEILLRRWAKAKGGAGQVVLLSGEAGIGKSRLTAALLEHTATEPHTRLRYFCSPQHTDSALYPIISQMERAAGFAHDDIAAVKLDKLDTRLAQSFTPRQDAAVFAEMLSLPNDGRYPTLELSAQQRRQKTLEALTAQLEALSRSNPVLMMFEDVHWSDPTSLEALGRTVGRIRTLSVLLIVTYRPEFAPPWIGQPHVTALTINRLGDWEIAAMIDLVTGNKPLPASIRLDIIERTDGIPLFVEEMTKAVLEAESQGDAQQTAAAIPPSALAVPASLHASLMARLDRLGSAKDVAQIGAAIGREFSHPLLAAVVAEPEAKLQSALDRLMTAGLLFRQGAPPHATYLFKHALVQDAAWHPLRDPRRALHARIAETLDTQFAEIAERQPELLARHCTEAGLIEKAAGLWGKAGRRSLERSALVEAAEQLTRALDQIATLPAYPVAASRGNQAAGRAHHPPRPCQRVCGTGNESGRGAGTSADRTSRWPRRASRRPPAAVLRPLRLLGRELCGVQRQRSARACGAVPGARRESRGDSATHDGPSPHGLFRKHCGRPSALRSGARALRSCRASSAGDAFRPRRPGGNLVQSVAAPGDAWLSRGRARRRRSGDQVRARDKPSRQLDVYPVVRIAHLFALRELRGGKRAH